MPEKMEQGSNEWKQARLGMITGTRIASAIGTPVKQDSLLNELIAEVLTGESKETYQNGAMERGIELEEEAVNLYELLTGTTTHQEAFLVSEKYQWLGISPDRLLGANKAVEIKCPNSDTAVKYIRQGGIPKEYAPQIAGYFLIMPKLEELDFVVYDPRILNANYRMTITTVKRQDLPLDETLKKLLSFREKWTTELNKLNIGL
jgi:putative phage-type endonuclease